MRPVEQKTTSRLTALSFIVAALIVLATVVRAIIFYSNGAFLSHATGAWATLANDLAQGLFYRPIYSSEIGFGGTRYFPLHFSLQALGYKALGDLTTAGFLVTVISETLLITGLLSLFRLMGLTWQKALLFAVLALGGASMQATVTTIRGDLLPLALNVWGLVACVASSQTRWKIHWAALFFVLAMTAKVTAVYGVAAAVAWLFLTQHRKQALLLAVFFTLGSIAALGIFQFASEGRFIENLIACADGGARGSAWFEGPAVFFQILWEDDWVVLAFFLMAIVGFGLSPRSLRTLPGLCWLAVVAVLVVVYGSPGTEYNHLIDLQVSSVIVFAGLSLDLHKYLRFLAPVLLFAAVIVLAGVLHLMAFKDPRHDKFAKVQTLLQLMGPAQSGLMLSEDPMVPLLAGEPVYLQDPFSLRLLRRKRPELSEPLFQALREHRFRAVVLIKDPDLKPRWYVKYHFGEGFIEELRRNYSLKENLGNYLIYVPN